MAVNEIKSSAWKEAVQMIECLNSKITEADTVYTSMQQKLNDVLEENVRLQENINIMKKKPCVKCAKLIECTEMLKKKLKEKDDTISVIGKLFLNHNPESYALASQMVNDVITSSTADITVSDKTTVLVDSDPQNKLNFSSVTPEKKNDPIDSSKKESPIVAKKNRNNKRKFLSISSVKKNKQSNGDAVSNISGHFGHDNEQELNETKILNVDKKAAEMDENCDKSIDYTTQSNSVASPEILSSSFRTDLLSTSKNDETANMTPTNDFRKSRRSLEMKFMNSDEKNHVSIEAEKIFKPIPERSDAKKSEPMDLEIAEAIQPLPEPVMENNKDLEKQSPKTVWNLKKSRELTIKKLKQTVLSTAVLEKKIDISTSNEYKGGSIPSNPAKPDANVCKFSYKENIDETFFEPPVTSTHNDFEIGAQPCQSKTALAESTNKPRTPVKIDDSFDCLPSTSPKYKYKRDAVRKKSERLKLPGQECSKCLDFYSSKKMEFSNSQVRKLMNKCSRHRDKFPIQVYTPPGLWNPVFDDTDEEVDNK